MVKIGDQKLQVTHSYIQFWAWVHIRINKIRVRDSGDVTLQRAY